MASDVSRKLLALVDERLSRVSSALALEADEETIDKTRTFVDETVQMVRSMGYGAKARDAEPSWALLPAYACRCASPVVDGPGCECVMCGRYVLADLIVTALEVRYGGQTVHGDPGGARPTYDLGTWAPMALRQHLARPDVVRESEVVTDPSRRDNLSEVLIHGQANGDGDLKATALDGPE